MLTIWGITAYLFLYSARIVGSVMIQAMILPRETHFNDNFYISYGINKIQIAKSYLS